MPRIFWYELKRLIFNRLFLALITITAVYSYITLTREIILGIAFTAPFSPWSYGAYLAKVQPLLMITLLFFITFMYSNHEKQVGQLTFATPVNPFKLGLVKVSAMSAGYFVISLFILVLSMVFYAMLFRFYRFSDFILPIIVILIPNLLFFLGAGLLLGGKNANTLYILMIATLMLGFLPGILPGIMPHPAFLGIQKFLDMYGSSLFSTYPLALPIGLDGEPLFSLPVSFILGRIFFSTTGVLMALLGLKRYAK